MKTYLFNLIDKYKQYSQKLDVQAILCQKAWYVLNEDGNSEVLIFKPDNTGHASVKGNTRMFRWEFLPQNNSLLINHDEMNGIMLNPSFFENGILICQKDGTDDCMFLVDNGLPAEQKFLTLQAVKISMAAIEKKHEEQKRLAKERQEELKRQEEERKKRGEENLRWLEEQRQEREAIKQKKLEKERIEQEIFQGHFLGKPGNFLVTCYTFSAILGIGAGSSCGKLAELSKDSIGYIVLGIVVGVAALAIDITFSSTLKNTLKKYLKSKGREDLLEKVIESSIVIGHILFVIATALSFFVTWNILPKIR